MNPPFGTRNKGADVAFLGAALRVSGPVDAPFTSWESSKKERLLFWICSLVCSFLLLMYHFFFPFFFPSEFLLPLLVLHVRNPKANIFRVIMESDELFHNRKKKHLELRFLPSYSFCPPSSFVASFSISLSLGGGRS